MVFGQARKGPFLFSRAAEKWQRVGIMDKNEFRELAHNDIILLDGATGTSLLEAGMPDHVCAEKWITENPQAILKLQREYVKAGSRIIYAPTFGANRIRLKRYGLEGEVKSLNAQAVALSRKAAGSALVAGDISMSGETLEPYGDLEYEELVDAYKEQALALEEAGADLIVAETIMDLNEAKAALEASLEATDLAVMVTMTFESSAKTMFGVTPAQAAKTLADMGACAVGANCSAGPEQMIPVVEEMAAAVDIPIIAKPNAGKPLPSFGKRVRYDIDQDTFAVMMTKIVDAGANIIGGCCGTTPEYIKQLSILCENMTFNRKTAEE